MAGELGHKNNCVMCLGIEKKWFFIIIFLFFCVTFWKHFSSIHFFARMHFHFVLFLLSTWIPTSHRFDLIDFCVLEGIRGFHLWSLSRFLICFSAWAWETGRGESHPIRFDFCFYSTLHWMAMSCLMFISQLFLCLPLPYCSMSHKINY